MNAILAMFGIKRNTQPAKRPPWTFGRIHSVQDGYTGEITRYSYQQITRCTKGRIRTTATMNIWN